MRLDVSDKLAMHEAMLGIEEEIGYVVGGKALVDNVAIGDIVDVLCENGNEEQFWLLLCDKPVHTMLETFTNAYKNTYYEGNFVIHDCYYELI
jgi:hypothetical protein